MGADSVMGCQLGLRASWMSILGRRKRGCIVVIAGVWNWGLCALRGLMGSLVIKLARVTSEGSVLGIMVKQGNGAGIVVIVVASLL